MSRPTTWTTRDGRVLAISEMTTDHIKNARAMLLRKGYCSVDGYLDALLGAASLNGEMAQYYAWGACDGMRPCGALDSFDAELLRRRLRG